MPACAVQPRRGGGAGTRPLPLQELTPPSALLLRLRRVWLSRRFHCRLLSSNSLSHLSTPASSAGPALTACPSAPALQTPAG